MTQLAVRSLVLNARGEGLAETARPGSPWYATAREWAYETGRLLGLKVEDQRSHRPRSNRFLQEMQAIGEGRSDKTVWAALKAERSRQRAGEQRKRLSEEAAVARAARGEPQEFASAGDADAEYLARQKAERRTGGKEGFKRPAGSCMDLCHL